MNYFTRSYLVTRSQNVLRCLIRNTEVESVRGKPVFFEGDFAAPPADPPPPLSSETSNFWFLFGSKFNSLFLLLIFSFSFSISGVWVVIEWDLPHLFLWYWCLCFLTFLGEAGKFKCSATLDSSSTFKNCFCFGLEARRNALLCKYGDVWVYSWGCFASTR